MDRGTTTGMAISNTDEPEADMAKKKGADDRKGRPPISPSGATRPTTFRISPGGMVAIRELSARLGLDSQAGAIETAAAQLLDALERCDAAPPLTDDQLALAVAAVKSARIIPRSVGPTARFGVVLLAAILAHEAVAVPDQCTQKEFAALIDTIRQFSAAEALWVMAAAIGE